MLRVQCQRDNTIYQYHNTMIKKTNSDTVRGGAYSAPRIEMTNAAIEAGFAASDWNDGSIPDTEDNYNYWDNL